MQFALFRKRAFLTLSKLFKLFQSKNKDMRIVGKNASMYNVGANFAYLCISGFLEEPKQLTDKIQKFTLRSCFNTAYQTIKTNKK